MSSALSRLRSRLPRGPWRPGPGGTPPGWLAALAPAVDRLARVAALASAWRRRLGGEQAGLVLLYHRVDRRPGDLERELVPAVARDAFAAQLAINAAPPPAG